MLMEVAPPGHDLAQAGLDAPLRIGGDIRGRLGRGEARQSDRQGHRQSESGAKEV